MTTATIPLHIPTVGQLGRHMAARQSGFFVPAPSGFALGDEVEVALKVADDRQSTRLRGVIVDPASGAGARIGSGGQNVVQVQLDRASWKALFVCVCRTPWRRSEDIATEPGDKKRLRLAEAAQCYVPRTGQRYAASLIEVSDRGAFLAIDGAELARDETVRFRARHDSSWHTARVRWSGAKDTHPGVGVQIEFEEPADRSRWVTYLAFASRRAA